MKNISNHITSTEREFTYSNPDEELQEESYPEEYQNYNVSNDEEEVNEDFPREDSQDIHNQYDEEINYEENIRDDEPIYIMTLELEKGVPENIRIYADSNPAGLAYEFCIMHNLDQNTMEYLAKEIEALILSKNSICSDEVEETHRDKIVEVDEEDLNTTEKPHVNDKSNNINEIYSYQADVDSNYPQQSESVSVVKKSAEILYYSTDNKDSLDTESYRYRNRLNDEVRNSSTERRRRSAGHEVPIPENDDVHYTNEDLHAVDEEALQLMEEETSEKDTVIKINEDDFEEIYKENEVPHDIISKNPQGISIHESNYIDCNLQESSSQRIIQHSNLDHSGYENNEENEIVEDSENKKECNIAGVDITDEGTQSKRQGKDTYVSPTEEADQVATQLEDMKNQIDSSPIANDECENGQNDNNIEHTHIDQSNMISQRTEGQAKLFPYELFIKKNNKSQGNTIMNSNRSNVLLNNSVKSSITKQGKNKPNIFDRLFLQAEMKRKMPVRMNHRLTQGDFNEHRTQTESKQQNLNFGEYLYYKEKAHKIEKELKLSRIKLQLENNENNTFHPKINNLPINPERSLHYSCSAQEYLKHKEKILNDIKEKTERNRTLTQDSIFLPKEKGFSKGNNYSTNATRQERKLSRLKKIEQEYRQKFSFRPNVHNYQTEMNFDERQKVYLERKEKNKKDLQEEVRQPIDENGQPMFKPNLISKPYVKESNMNVYDKNYDYARKYSKNKQELHKKLYEVRPVHPRSEENNEILQRMKEETFRNLFKDLDQDQDNMITPLSIGLKHVSKEVQRVLHPIINEMKQENETLNEDEFARAMMHLYEVISPNDRRVLFAHHRNKSSSSLGRRSASVSNDKVSHSYVNRKSRSLAKRYDQRINQQFKDKHIIRDYETVDRDTYFNSNPSSRLNTNTGSGILSLNFSDL